MSAPNSDLEARICAQLDQLQSSVDELRNRVEHLATQSKCRDVPTDPSAMLTANEVAALLRVDVRTLRVMRHERSFPRPTRVGRSLRWRRGAIERWIDGGAR